MRSGETIIELKSVSLESESQGYLSDLDLCLVEGEKVILFGPESSGLDLLFPLIMGFTASFQGDVLYRGKSIRELDYTGALMHKKNFGYLHGQYGLISNMSVRQNISLPLEYHSQLNARQIRECVDELIDGLNLDHCKNLRPVDLTRSEMLRTTYARACAMDPPVFLVEHPLDGQSPMNVQSFMNHLREKAENGTKTILLITYEPEKFLDLADRCVMLFSGRIVYNGPVGDFHSSENPYLRQYRDKAQTGPMVIL